MFALPYSAEARAGLPFDPAQSWLIGEARRLGLGLALVVLAASLAAGGAGLAWADRWPTATASAAGLSLALLVLYWSRWWTLGGLIDVGLIGAAIGEGVG